MSLLRTEERRAADERRAAEQRDARRTIEENEARTAEAQRAARRAEDIEDAKIKSEIKRGEIRSEQSAGEQPRGNGHAAPASAQPNGPQQPAPLFGTRAAQELREQWDATQISFVDNPRQAVQRADELVAEVIRTLSQSFSEERTQLEAQLNSDQASTEQLRVALQRYRTLFQRVLSL